MPALDLFPPAVSRWFRQLFGEPTDVQERGWRSIATGRDTLLISPTGSGKTLAAFSWGLGLLADDPLDDEPGVRILYLSPLKALAQDVERNLRQPLLGIARAADALGEPFEPPEVFVRTGDTPQRARQRFLRQPARILVTTPESLYLMLGSKAREALRGVHTVIVDEIHVMAGTKRGVHLSLSLERLTALCPSPPQRVGLSATVRPVKLVAAWLSGGGAPAAVVDASGPPRLDLRIEVPAPEPIPQQPEELDFAADGMGGAAFQNTGAGGPWPGIQRRIVELVRQHTSTIVFVNSRGLCERLARRLNELAGEELVQAHHGSVSHGQRAEIEQALKDGALRGIVATSSLELGLDMGAVDLVLLVESPGSTARGLQRVGRAGHQVGERSVGRIFPKHPGDLLASAVVAQRMERGDIEPLSVPRNALDVLAQQLVAMCCDEPRTVGELGALVRAALPYRELGEEALRAVLDMLSGRYPSTDFADLRPRLDWDRQRDLLSPRRGVKQMALINGGTIPDRGLYGVYVAPYGPRVGELDEEMVHESRAGEAFVLGATTWRVQEIDRDRVWVVPAPGVPGKMPFWKGDGLGRPVLLGRALGDFLDRWAAAEDGAALLRDELPAEPHVADKLHGWLATQREHSAIPGRRRIVVERFRDPLGDWRLCVLCPLGARVLAPWALALEAKLSREAGFEVQATWTDDGFTLSFADSGDQLPGLRELLVDPDELDELLLEQLPHSGLFAASFRENAVRALLLTRSRPGKRQPLWAQRHRASQLLAVALRHPDFPITLETWRSLLADRFDVSALKELLGGLRRREVTAVVRDCDGPSPFARSLLLELVGVAMYEQDAPRAERRVRALQLDRALLRDLLGTAELRELLVPEVLVEVQDELQGRAEGRRARHAEGLQDLLRRVGALDSAALRERCEGEPEPWLAELEAAGRVVQSVVVGRPRWMAVEDAALYRDALGVAHPDLPAELLAPRPGGLLDLVSRFARTHGPFTTPELAAELGLPPGALEPALYALQERGDLEAGGFRPGGEGEEFCDATVLRRLRRRSLERLRGEVEPVDGSIYGAFLRSWQGVGGQRSLYEALEVIEGLPLSLKDLEERILPARVSGYAPRDLDALVASGQVRWVGRGLIGARDVRLSLHLAGRSALVPSLPDEPPSGAMHEAIRESLRRRGASFVSTLRADCVPAQRAARPKPGESTVSEQFTAALWDLVAAGEITNDSLAPLRSRGQVRAGRGRSRRRARSTVPGAGGRWSLVERAAGDATRDALEIVEILLERYGVLSDDVARQEGIAFGRLYPVLKARAEVGELRRGWFVKDLGGLQFALPEAVEALRSVEVGGEWELAAQDPAVAAGTAKRVVGKAVRGGAGFAGA